MLFNSKPKLFTGDNSTVVQSCGIPHPFSIYIHRHSGSTLQLTILAIDHDHLWPFRAANMVILSGPQQNAVGHQDDTIDTMAWTMVTFKIDQCRSTKDTGDPKSQTNSFGKTNGISGSEQSRIGD